MNLSLPMRAFYEGLALEYAEQAANPLTQPSMLAFYERQQAFIADLLS